MIYVSVGPLVRAVSSTSACIWAELSAACTVSLSAQSEASQHASWVAAEVQCSTTTTCVGGRYYALLYLQDLQPRTWYQYTLSICPKDAGPDKHVQTEQVLPQQCFRTFDHSMKKPEQALRIAYGSCRNARLSRMGEADALASFGDWLLQRYEQREEMWPHALLLIGDQIYADDPPLQLLQEYPNLQDGAHTFEEFALLYQYAWTCDEGVRQALAVLPTYMIFDDHEITNNWNNAPLWRAEALRRGKEQLLIDGLVAYWVYQGWGNLLQSDTSSMPLLAVMQRAKANGEDALDALREAVKADVYGEKPLPWHYEVLTDPPIFVINARTERTAFLTDAGDELFLPTHIIGKEQMRTLQEWLHQHDDERCLIASSVPILLPPVIATVEYLAGLRLWQKNVEPLRQLGRKLSQLQQRVASRSSFDHWPLYGGSWHELIESLQQRKHDVLVLSGDVHFSYAAQAHSKHSPARLYQFVSTPLLNELSSSNFQKIRLQGHISRMSYGGLSTKMLPLTQMHAQAKIQTDILFQNAIALLTLHPEDTQKLEHIYLGIVEGEMLEIGHTKLEGLE